MRSRSIFVVAALLMAVGVNATTVYNPEVKVLYYLRDDKLYRLKPPSIKEEMLEQRVANFELDGNGEPLWMDRDARIYRSPDELVVEPSISSKRFAFDHLTNKFYIVDGDSQKIEVLQADGRAAALFDGRFDEDPKMIALDPGSGFMFILTDIDGVKNIYRSDMDGTRKRMLVEDVSSDELSIDARRRKVYWLNSRWGVVENVDFEGIERRSIEELDGVANDTSVAVFDGEIYWSINGGLINVCKLDENSCDNNTLHQFKIPSSIHPIKHLRVSYKSKPKVSLSTFACRPSNDGCQHMCLLNSRSGSSCVCYVGFEPDGKECVRIKPRSYHSTKWWDYMTPYPTWRPRQEQQSPNNNMANAAMPAIIGK